MAGSKVRTDEATSRKDLSVSMTRANVVGPLLVLPPMLVFCLAYILIWGVEVSFEFGLGEFFAFYAGALGVIIAGVVAHELLHGLSFVWIGGQPLGNVKLLGFQRKTLSPYARCKVPVRARAYRWAVAMPGLVLGVLPSLVAVATGSGWFLLFGLFFLFAASGDAIILWAIRGVKSGALVEDHPERAGCFVVGS